MYKRQVYTISLVINVVLNAVFIFGLLGAPALGVRGAALATAAARYCEFFIVLFYACRINKQIRVKMRYLIHTERVLVSDSVSYTHLDVYKRQAQAYYAIFVLSLNPTIPYPHSGSRIYNRIYMHIYNRIYSGICCNDNRRAL